jgi:hypothetical protein
VNVRSTFGWTANWWQSASFLIRCQPPSALWNGVCLEDEGYVLLCACAMSFALTDVLGAVFARC